VERCGSREKELHDSLLKLKPSIKKKEGEKQKHRELAKEEEENLNRMLNKFNNEVSSLKALNSEIDLSAKRFVDNRNIEELDENINKLRVRVAEKRSQIEMLEPELENLTRRIGDQERHRKLIQENISLIEASHRIDDLSKDIERLKKEKEKILGHATAALELDEATAIIVDLRDKRARKEGRRSGFAEQIRSLKVRLLHQMDRLSCHSETNILCSIPITSASLHNQNTKMSTSDIAKQGSSKRQQQSHVLILTNTTLRLTRPLFATTESR
jgi:chromosome segregation ATPase